MNHKDIQGFAMAGPLLGKPSLPVKIYTYRKQAEIVLTILHTVETVNLGGGDLISLHLVCLWHSHTQKSMNEPSFHVI